jgi:D-alanine-D-alanine ligase
VASKFPVLGGAVVQHAYNLKPLDEPIGQGAAPLQLVDPVELLQARLDRLRDRLRIAVIFGGDKAADGAVIHRSQNPRPWKSYEEVARDIGNALSRLGFRHVEVMPDDMRLFDRLRRGDVDLAWLNTGGVQGFNPASHTPGMLEMLGVPYVGHDPLVSTVLDNKHAFKRELSGVGIPTAPFMTWHVARGPFLPNINSRFAAIFGGYKGPFVVKPVSGRASLHVHVVDNVADLTDAVATVHEATANTVLIESFLPGREFCIAVCGPITSHGGRLRRQKTPFSFAALERHLSADERIFTSMDVRPITQERFRRLDEASDANVLSELRRLARDVFLEFNLNGLIRLDIRSDDDGNLFVLEANPKPDLKAPSETSTSLVCGDLPQHGMSYDDLIYSLLADRFDHLFTHRRDSVQHIVRLLA